MVKLFLFFLTFLVFISQPTQIVASAEFERRAPVGKNYSIAEFKLWYPEDISLIEGIVVLVPGYNQDGRSLVYEKQWQEFAIKNKLALIGCRFTDKPHESMSIEEYARASKGSGQALLDAIKNFSEVSGHRELMNSHLMLWGFSAGGQFNYEFVAWRPSRIIGFVVNKGGIYFSALLSDRARKVPALMFIGEKDLERRKDVIKGIFAVNRHAGALWALLEEPSIGHAVGKSREMSIIFFDDLIKLHSKMSPIPGSKGRYVPSEEDGFVGNKISLSVEKFSAAAKEPSNQLSYWFPTERVGLAWLDVLANRDLPK
jgi:dienelactone hydrolase